MCHIQLVFTSEFWFQILPRDVPLQPPPCRQDWDSNIRSSKHCAAIQSSLFSECHRKVQPDYYFKACRIDMCECPGTQCHCEVNSQRNILGGHIICLTRHAQSGVCKHNKAQHTANAANAATAARTTSTHSKQKARLHCGQ